MNAFGFVSVMNPQGHAEVVRYDTFVAGLLKQFSGPDAHIMNKLHCAVGISGEAGEFLDQIKKQWVYNRAPDRVNEEEELGDLLFYIQAYMNVAAMDIQNVLQRNANKLADRYVGLQYSDAAAHARADKKVEGEN
jgi:hypothetical protein